MMFPFTCTEKKQKQTSLNFTFISHLSYLYFLAMGRSFFSLRFGPPQLSFCLSVGLKVLTSNSTFRSSSLPFFLSLLTLQLRISEGMLSDITNALNQTTTNLNADRQQILGQLHHASKEVGRLQLELALERHTSEKKVISFVSKVLIQILKCEFL